MVPNVTVVNVDTTEEVARELINELRKAAGKDGPHYFTLDEIASQTDTIATISSVAFLFMRKEGGAYAANESCRILTKRCRQLAQRIDRASVRNVAIVDCATDMDMPVSDFSILGECLRIISEEITSAADADVICLDYERDATVMQDDAILISSITSIREDEFVEKALSYCLRNVTLSKETVFS